MLEIIQYLHKKPNILDLLKENRISLLNVNELEQSLTVESFKHGEKKTFKDPHATFWRP
ncbi:competence pheromone ComX [Lysinibacillus mangiferihumi]|uniref:Competence pheromone ComX n=1 Tax=Lysinibacillus mangiferihumi TaxID=1130819 RepID=A0A4U2ZCZ1_9BACI|nr:competence pheromone ComX [Lysinibacillus mangiferihumi]TKI71612.1 competence pheromone ComX [Lysinibacillus mangiferihumi]